jgi:hypothetical protein
MNEFVTKSDATLLTLSAILSFPFSLLGKYFSSPLELDHLTNDLQGAVVHTGKAKLGVAVNSAGDVNGDGLDDLILGANLASPNNKLEAGESYVIFGQSQGIDLNLSLQDLKGIKGFKLNGAKAGDRSGVSVHGAGDINGDGFDDVIVGAYFADPNGKGNAGESYVVFGRKDFLSAVELDGLDGIHGFQINGVGISDRTGTSVSRVGDMNGDGFDDIIIGAPMANPNGKDNAGVSYVIFGKSQGFAAKLELADLNGVNGFRLNGEVIGDFSGRSVGGVGDVNGDGFDDLCVGAPYVDFNGKKNVGASYIIFGKQEGFAATLELSALNGSNGFKLVGVDSYDFAGRSVSGAEDFNGDGLDDIIIGASGEFPAGESYVVFGSKSGFPAVFELISLNGSNGFKLSGINSGDQSGIAVSGVGDVNGDGMSDIVVGARYATSNGKKNAGQSYLIFGQRTDINSKLELETLDGKKGIFLNGANAEENSGTSVGGGGDFNGDEISDLIIGAPGAGKAYVLYGKDMSPLGDFTGNGVTDLLFQYSRRILKVLPLEWSNEILVPELENQATVALPIDPQKKNGQQKNHQIPLPDEDNDDTPTQKPPGFKPPSKILARPSSRFSSLDFDGAGVSDLLIKEKNNLKIFLLDNQDALSIPTILNEINFALPKGYRYFGAGAIIDKKNRKLDLVLKKGKSLFVAENLGSSFSVEFKPLIGKVSGKMLAIRNGEIITLKGKKLFGQKVNGLTIGIKKELGQWVKNQKPVMMVDFNQDGINEVVTLDRKRKISYVNVDDLSGKSVPITILPKKAKLIRFR